MITLNVFFEEYDPNYTDGTAVLYENLITNEVKLILNSHLIISETYKMLDIAVDILKTRYSEVRVNINWEIDNKVEESDK